MVSTVETAQAPIDSEPLTPTAFLDRAMVAYADRTAVIDGGDRWTYAEFGDRCQRQAGMLAGLGVRELSMPASRIAAFKAALRDTDSAAAEAAARRALDQPAR